MNNLPLQPLKWSQKNLNPLAELELTAYSALHEYVLTEPKQGKFELKKTRLSKPDKKSEFLPYFDTVTEAKAWAWNHYNEKMQPYVKPAPTWIDVDDRLPEMYQRVLIKADCYLVAGREPKSERNKDWGITGEWMWAIVNDSWTDSHMVTHWMPIPEFSTMKNLHKGE